MKIDNSILQATVLCSLLSTGAFSFSPLYYDRAKRTCLYNKPQEMWTPNDSPYRKKKLSWLTSDERFSPEWLQKKDKHGGVGIDESDNQMNDGGAPDTAASQDQQQEYHQSPENTQQQPEQHLKEWLTPQQQQESQEQQGHPVFPSQQEQPSVFPQQNVGGESLQQPEDYGRSSEQDQSWASPNSEATVFGGAEGGMSSQAPDSFPDRESMFGETEDPMSPLDTSGQQDGNNDVSPGGGLPIMRFDEDSIPDGDKQDWLVSEERFSPEWLQRSVVKNVDAPSSGDVPSSGDFEISEEQPTFPNQQQEGGFVGADQQTPPPQDMMNQQPQSEEEKRLQLTRQMEEAVQQAQGGVVTDSKQQSPPQQQAPPQQGFADSLSQQTPTRVEDAAAGADNKSVYGVRMDFTPAVIKVDETGDDDPSMSGETFSLEVNLDSLDQNDDDDDDVASTPGIPIVRESGTGRAVVTRASADKAVKGSSPTAAFHNRALALHRDKRLSWDNTNAKQRVEEEVEKRKAEIERKYKEDLEKAELAYKEGLEKCENDKKSKVAEVEKTTPEATDLAVGIATMGKALRHMSDDDEEKKELEAEWYLWIDQYDKVTEEGQGKQQ